MVSVTGHEPGEALGTQRLGRGARQLVQVRPPRAKSRTRQRREHPADHEHGDDPEHQYIGHETDRRHQQPPFDVADRTMRRQCAHHERCAGRQPDDDRYEQ